MDAKATIGGVLTLVPMADPSGVVVFVPAPTIEAFKVAGKTMMQLALPLNDAADTAGWLRISEAAAAHADDVAGLSEDALQKRVSRAMAAGRFKYVETAAGKRIDPTSFAAWRLYERIADLDKSEVP